MSRDDTCLWTAFSHNKSKGCDCDVCKDLKPCPCCGGTNIMKICSPMGKPDMWIRCVGCGLSTKEYNTIGQATKAWNKRTN